MIRFYYYNFKHLVKLFEYLVKNIFFYLVQIIEFRIFQKKKFQSITTFTKR